MKIRLNKKIIIVTGGDGLLGKSIVSRLKSEGAICINFELEKETSIDLSYVNCDITNEFSIDKAISIVIEKYGRIDGLVNNAYPRTLDWGKKFEDIELESWRKNVDWQLNSYFYISQRVSSYMAGRNEGTIVNIASIYGVIAPDFRIYEGTEMTMPAAYSAIKGGLISLTRYMASYLGPKQIRVNSISPGGIFDFQDKEFVKKYENKVPLRRMGTNEDISPSVVFLLSDESKYITGQNLIIDGGISIL